ncbi:TTAGGG repeat binding factor [Basidiobolus ranarum]|uniref:TTAGGG repeat binding factor n=1 Tax=Basidiobolus ranarum TaxID=34480 RepID=A0ABR2W772_9FUNG
MARTKKRVLKKGQPVDTKNATKTSQITEKEVTPTVETAPPSSEDSEYIIPDTLSTEEEFVELFDERETAGFIDEVLRSDKKEKQMLENLSELEWLIADLFAHKVLDNVLLSGDNPLNVPESEHMNEAKKYWKDLQALLKHHDIIDLSELSRSVMNSSDANEYKDILLRILMASLCQTHFEDENNPEKIYSMLLNICEVLLPCILSQNTTFDICLVRFWIDLKTQAIVYGKHQGEDGAELVEKHYGEGSDHLFDHIHFGPSESSSRIEKEKRLYNKMVSVRAERYTNFSVEEQSNELPWIRFLRVVRSFVSRSISQLPTPKLLKSITESNPTSEQIPSGPDAQEIIPSKPVEVTKEQDIPIVVHAHMVKELEAMGTKELATEIEHLEPIFNVALPSTSEKNGILKIKPSKNTQKSVQFQESSPMSHGNGSIIQSSQTLANNNETPEKASSESNVHTQDPLTHSRSQGELMAEMDNNQEAEKKRKRYIHESSGTGVRVRWSTPPSDFEEEEPRATDKAVKFKLDSIEAPSEKKRKLDAVSSAPTTNIPVIYSEQKEAPREREHSSSRRKAKGKAPWTQDELDALYEGMRMFGTAWSTVLSHFGEKGVIDQRLRGRTQVQLKDKARNERRRREKVGLPLDVFEEACI